MSYKQGFTIIELLVSIGIIAVVASLSVVSLSRARKSASMTKDLSLIRQNAAATLSYTTDFKETFPIVGDSSFDVVYWWYECLITSGHLANRQAVDPNYKEPPVHDRSRFEFTRTTSTAQRYFTYEEAGSRPPLHLEAQRMAIVAFPSQKGMIVRGWTGDFPYFTPSNLQYQLNLEWFFGNTPTPVASMDGAGRVDARAKMVGGNPEVVINHAGIPFYSTWGGLSGIDWK
jgi:prepilin-type N-terminal cleavage/methylation domain-containing protein